MNVPLELRHPIMVGVIMQTGEVGWEGGELIEQWGIPGGPQLL